jgi:hypothetical protein
MDVRARPRMYIYPDSEEGFAILDDDEELIEDALVVLCAEQSCHIWKGELFKPESTQTEAGFINAV